MIDLRDTAPGTRSSVMVRTNTGPVTEVPLTVIRGAAEGPTLLVTAGVHGAEYASIEAALRLGQLDPAALSGTLVLLPLVNHPAFAARSIYINPLDGKNLNRVFPGDPQGTFAEQLADWLTTGFVQQADAWIDLHGGDMNEALTPFVIHRRGDEPSRQLASEFGISYVVSSASEGSSYSVGQQLGIPAIIAEASGQGVFNEPEITILVDGVKRVMQARGMLEGTPFDFTPVFLDSFNVLKSAHDGFWYLDAAMGQQVRAGDVLGEIRNFLGEPLEQITAPVDGVVLYAVASLAINSGDPLVGIGH